MTDSDTNESGKHAQRLKLIYLLALEETVDLDSWSKWGMGSLGQLSTEVRSGFDGERVIDVLQNGEMPHLAIIKEHGKRLEHHGTSVRDRLKGDFLYRIAMATMVADYYAGGPLGLPIHGHTTGKNRPNARGYRITGRPTSAVVAMLADMMEDRTTPSEVMSVLKRAYRNLTAPPSTKKEAREGPTA